MRPTAAVFRFIPFLAVALFAAPAQAQSLSIGSGDVRPGASIDIPVRFDAVALPVVAFSMRVVYDNTLFNPPVCIAHHGAFCSVNHSKGWVSLLHFDVSLRPLASADYMTIRLRPLVTVPRTTTRLGAREIILVNPLAEEVDGTIYTGQIVVR